MSCRDDRVAGSWGSVDGLLDQAVEQLAPGSGGPPVESEREFVEVVVEVGVLDGALVRTEQRSLQEGGNTMYTRERTVQRGRIFSRHDGFMAVAPSAELGITGPAVCSHSASGLDGCENEPFQARCRSVRQAFQANAPDSVPVLLRGDRNDGLAAEAAPERPFVLPSHVGLVHFHDPAQAVATRTDHGAAQLVQPGPRGPLLAQAEHPLQPERTGTILLRRHPPHRLEPSPQGLASAFEDGSGCQRRLVPATAADETIPLGRPSRPAATARANETVRPPDPGYVVAARLLGVEPSLEFRLCARITLLHDLDHNILIYWSQVPSPVIGIDENYWQNLVGVLLAFALLALTVERALYQIFDSKLWRLIEMKLDEQAGGDYLDLKPWVSVAVSVTLTLTLKLDFIATVLARDEVEFLSMVLTGLFLAGGSTGIYKFLKRARKIKDAAAEAAVAKANGS